MSGVDHYWQFAQASLAGVREAQFRTTAAQPGGAEADAPFLTHIGQVLGEETVPDSEFFIDNWTVGFAAASENFLRRHEQPNIRAHEMPEWHTFSFTPWFVAKAESSAATAWPCREARAGEPSMPDLRRVGNEQEDDWREADEVGYPLTPESACRVLGVAVTSTREQIRAAYRKMAGRYHPDRLAQSEAREQKLASDRMASINEAYRLLSKGLAAPWRPSYVS